MKNRGDYMGRLIMTQEGYDKLEKELLEIVKKTCSKYLEEIMTQLIQSQGIWAVLFVFLLPFHL